MHDRNADKKTVRRPVRGAAGRSAARHRPRRICRRHQFSASASHAHGAIGARPRPHRLHRHGGRARRAGCFRGVDRSRHHRSAADRFSRRQHSGARSLPPAGLGQGPRALCRRSGSGRFCRRPLRRRRRGRSGHVEIEELPPLLDAQAAPVEFCRATAAKRRSFARAMATSMPCSATPGTSSSLNSPSGGIPACRSKPAARSAATMPRAALLELHGAAKVPHRNQELLSRMLKHSAERDPCPRVACRRRLWHSRRALSRRRAGLRRREKIQPAGEMDRGPARAPDRGQSFTPAGAQDPRRGRCRRRDPRHRRSSISTTRAPMCAPMRRASCT